jgi:hypothetical protein
MIQAQEKDLVPGSAGEPCRAARFVLSDRPALDRLTNPDSPVAVLESRRGMSANRVRDRGSEPAGLNDQLIVPAHPRHDLLAVMLVARHDRLVVTVSKREPSLFGPRAAAFSLGVPGNRFADTVQTEGFSAGPRKIGKCLILLVPQTGFEPVTPSLRIVCSIH